MQVVGSRGDASKVVLAVLSHLSGRAGLVRRAMGQECWDRWRGSPDRLVGMLDWKVGVVSVIVSLAVCADLQRVSSGARLASSFSRELALSALRIAVSGPAWVLVGQLQAGCPRWVVMAVI